MDPAIRSLRLNLPADDQVTREMGAVRQGSPIYPNAVEAILIYIRALDNADNKINQLGLREPPFPRKIYLEDNEGSDYGCLNNEGAGWMWQPPA